MGYRPGLRPEDIGLDNQALRLIGFSHIYMQQSVYLLLGSNRGDRELNLLRACTHIRHSIGSILKASFVYETEPWGFEDSTPFHNQALEIETSLSPEELLKEIHSIEKELGRIRQTPECGSGYACSSEIYSSRTIDIDILFYGSKILFTDELMIPHPRLHERRFTLIPLDEIAPDYIHPVYRKPVSELLQLCNDKGEVNRISL
ncbi:MAG: 2-amino-4-hydroxy-6-hydroxymethyldihydropteridine diphosphokinase [Bacteroidetes bacterium]|nr:2-amino-4-hydroxy-6-hydroxymethyldihydropteridine diphosphokinase [Bacteroidota bacterium]